MEKIFMPFNSVFGEPSVCVWQSRKHFAALFDEQDAFRLDICRTDMSDGMTWDELQAVKNDCGYETMDAVEYYPAQSDVINTGNIRHLYIFKDRIKDRLPHIRRRDNG